METEAKYRDLGVRAVQLSHSVGLSCHHCKVQWAGCAAECCCPECGAPKGYWSDAWDLCFCESCEHGRERGERVEREIPVAAIRVDRWPLNPTTLALVDYLRGGGEVPAIKVQTVSGGGGGGWRILDGRHRVTAAKLLGRSTIRARFSTKPAAPTP